METPKEKLFLIPKGSNGLRLHPRAFVDENMKSYEKVTGILLSVEQIEKLEAEKAELLEALEIFIEQNTPTFTSHDYEFPEHVMKAKSLIKKHKK